MDTTALHEKWLRHCFNLAQQARDRGDHPFGALLVSAEGECLMEAENTVESAADITGHAELNLIRRARQQFSADRLATCTLYTSTEPCPMCAGAIFWGNVRRVVFGLSEAGLYNLTGDSEEVLRLDCRAVFAQGAKAVEVMGPLLEDEARQVHEGFWR